jgi:hypothetical protein
VYHAINNFTPCWIQRIYSTRSHNYTIHNYTTTVICSITITSSDVVTAIHSIQPDSATVRLNLTRYSLSTYSYKPSVGQRKTHITSLLLKHRAYRRCWRTLPRVVYCCVVTAMSPVTSPRGKGTDCWLACYRSSGSCFDDVTSPLEGGVIYRALRSPHHNIILSLQNLTKEDCKIILLRLLPSLKIQYLSLC